MINNQITIKFISVVIILFICSSTSFSQTKLDTVYYDSNMKVVENLGLAETYEIRFIRKGKPHGLIKRFNKQDDVVESTTYEKGRKTGPYTLVKGDTLIKGTYKKGKKVNIWTYEHILDQNARMEVFDSRGNQLPSMDLPNFSTQGKDVQYTVEKDASFPGGPKAWSMFLRKNLRYPSAAKQAGIQGQVLLKFTVSKTGSLEEITMVSSPSHDLTLEALRVLKKSPNWIPATVKGEVVSSEMTIRVVFGLGRR
ncbi:hypothetical protein BFP97_08125 [Roseivirga sp. 4D4]|uniref:energy transducer TonB n=1 Tax=Roseivirga sp. 4D4 TaxID=1889784 RepID=UPI000852E7BD|nr:energy transducer TonB [Roseivirga sp. 4D4]OEK01488.1 hypothetical protein BFP97_08125 [Roseivirga sp. 4D4]